MAEGTLPLDEVMNLILDKCIRELSNLTSERIADMTFGKIIAVCDIAKGTKVSPESRNKIIELFRSAVERLTVFRNSGDISVNPSIYVLGEAIKALEIPVPVNRTR